MMHAKSRALGQTAVYRSIDGTCVANQIARYAIVGHWGMLSKISRFVYSGPARVTWRHNNRNYAAVLHGRPINMAVVQGERVPSRDYRKSLTAENQNRYDEKLKFTTGIDLYSVSASF